MLYSGATKNHKYLVAVQTDKFQVPWDYQRVAHHPHCYHREKHNKPVGGTNERKKERANKEKEIELNQKGRKK